MIIKCLRRSVHNIPGWNNDFRLTILHETMNRPSRMYCIVCRCLVDASTCAFTTSKTKKLYCLQARHCRVYIQSWHGTHGLVVLVVTTFFYTYSRIDMGPAGFEPATSSARGWHPAKLDNGPRIARCLDAIRIICLLIY